MEAIKVVKFGGSSLADATQFKKVYDIIKADETRRYVVPSAPGKRFKEDTKVTDLLYQAYNAKTELEFKNKFIEIKSRYQEIIDGLNLDFSLDKEFEIIEEGFKKGIGEDYAASRGEYLNGIILANYLDIDFIDAKDVIKFNKYGTLNIEETYSLLKDKLSQHERAVIPGFYGSDENGEVVTFSRGGSDVTGALVAASINANLYENWTDVSGFLMADPRIVNNPKKIKIHEAKITSGPHGFYATFSMKKLYFSYLTFV